MARTNYQRGREFEYRTRRKLEELGAVYIMRAASSKGAADLIALFPTKMWEGVGHKPQTVWLVQCKMDGRLPRKERAEIRRIAALADARPILAYKNKKGRLLISWIAAERGNDVILEGA